MPKCAKMIYALVMEVLSVAKAHMSPSTVQGEAVFVAFVVAISLVYIL